MSKNRHAILNGQLVFILMLPATVIGVWSAKGINYGLVSLGTALVSLLICVFIWGPLVLEIMRLRKYIAGYEEELDGFDILREIVAKIPPNYATLGLRKWLRDHPKKELFSGDEEAE